jgi:hypothetical protein
MKEVPIEERIAEMFIRGSYRDVRDGCSLPSFRPHRFPEIATAMGMIRKQCGLSVLMALETYFAGTMIHEPALRRSWDSASRTGKIERLRHEQIIVIRMGGTLAIRQLAGWKFSDREIAEYAWMIHTRRDHLYDSIRQAGAWLDGLWGTGTRALTSRFRAESSEPLANWGAIGYARR